MKTSEVIDNITDNEEWYASRSCGLYDLLSDFEEAIEEGYIENVSAYIKRGSERLSVYCEDGVVYVTRKNGHLVIETKLYETVTTHSRPRTASPYDRRRAAVYATGNRWAIENFNATH